MVNIFSTGLLYLAQHKNHLSMVKHNITRSVISIPYSLPHGTTFGDNYYRSDYTLCIFSNCQYYSCITLLVPIHHRMDHLTLWTLSVRSIRVNRAFTKGRWCQCLDVLAVHCEHNCWQLQIICLMVCIHKQVWLSHKVDFWTFQLLSPCPPRNEHLKL